MKNLIKLIIFIAFETLLINKFFRYLNKGKIKVLLFHNIVINSRQTLFTNAISKKIFIKQLQYLKKHYNIVSLSQNGEWHGLSNEKVNTINSNQMKKMLKNGMNIGSHSLYHNNFSKMSVSYSVQNAEQSKQKLENILKIPVKCFAFPWGFYQDQQMEPIKKIYRRIFTVKHGFNLKEDQILNRNEIDGFFHMCTTASGAFDWFKK